MVYLWNGTGSPLVNYSELAARWGISKATAGRVLKKFEKLEYISLMAFPGTKGSVVYLKNYLSTMFQISDVLVDKEEVAMSLNIKINPAYQNHTWRLWSGRWRKSLIRKGVPVSGAPKPDTSYILYRTTGRESIYAVRAGLWTGALGWRSAVGMGR